MILEELMKKATIPVLATLGCSLTGCISDENNKDTGEIDIEPSTEPSEEPVDIGDISEAVGLWALESYSYTYYGYSMSYSFPQEGSYSFEGYGVSYSFSEILNVYLDILDTGEKVFLW